MRSLQWTLIVAAGLTLAACGETTGSRTLSGGAMGAAGGAAIGAIAGDAGPAGRPAAPAGCSADSSSISSGRAISTSSG